ncbi:hypothetical protein EHS25_005555 [Saitozyma podzolica]|uniref:Ricin B lectin domain-containing protein n=1 Tax=Saitozyma podzolica TaxID=1890683 RepID=A0A427XXW3_9TREE|nr:hypothetical protein EHS25_005555 [Saitozyma podzolica]
MRTNALGHQFPIHPNKVSYRAHRGSLSAIVINFALGRSMAVLSFQVTYFLCHPQPLPLGLAAAVKRANPTIQLVNQCSNPVQPYITGNNPSGLPNPDVLQPGDAATYTFDQSFLRAARRVTSISKRDSACRTTTTGLKSFTDQTDQGWNFPFGINAIYKTSEGYCNPTLCNNPYCDSLTVYSYPPTIPSTPSNPAPQPPLYECASQSTDYQVVFCSGENPPTYVQLHPNGDTNKCLDLLGDIRQNGQPVQIYDCNGTPAQNWILNRGETKVMLAGTNFCLDATQGYPPDGTKMKIWTCYDGLPQQDWWWTDDNRIAL